LSARLVTSCALSPSAPHSLPTRRSSDLYLEDIRTLWLLHWHVATADDPLFAWDFLLNRWHRPEIVRSVVLPAFIREANSGARTRSEEHTSELQSRENIVCRLLLEKKTEP